MQKYLQGVSAIYYMVDSYYVLYECNIRKMRIQHSLN